MTAQEWAGKLARRWYVLAAVLLCTMGGLWAVHGRSITYRGCDELFLAGPPQPLNRNVITGQNASVPMTAGMVSAQLNSAPVRHQLQAAGVTSYYNVLMTNTGEVRFPAYTSPTLHICVSSTSPQAVLTATAAASRKFESLLYTMQAGLAGPCQINDHRQQRGAGGAPAHYRPAGPGVFRCGADRAARRGRSRVLD